MLQPGSTISVCDTPDAANRVGSNAADRYKIWSLQYTESASSYKADPFCSICDTPDAADRVARDAAAVGIANFGLFQMLRTSCAVGSICNTRKSLTLFATLLTASETEPNRHPLYTKMRALSTAFETHKNQMLRAASSTHQNQHILQTSETRENHRYYPKPCLQHLQPSKITHIISEIVGGV